MAATAVCVALSLHSVPVSAHEYKVGSIRIVHPWSRATPPVVPVAGGYVRLINTGQEPDRLLGVSSEIAEKAEIHESTITDGVARMRPLVDGLSIKAGETVELKPGEIHIMFIKPARSLKEGDRFEASLRFERAGTVKVEFMVQGMRGPLAEQQGSKPDGHGDHAE